MTSKHAMNASTTLQKQGIALVLPFNGPAGALAPRARGLTRRGERRWAPALLVHHHVSGGELRLLQRGVLGLDGIEPPPFRF